MDVRQGIQREAENRLDGAQAKKTYVLVTLNLCAMHGANMYIYNKTDYLKRNGWRVLVFSAEQGDILITGLQEYKQYQFVELRLYPSIFGTKRAEKYVDKICSVIEDALDGDQIVVESTNLVSAMWGELIAKRYHCCHLVFIMQERFHFSGDEKEYIRFKLDRHELAGIANDSVQKMLGDERINFDSSMHVRAFCTNTIDECEDTITPHLNNKADVTICSIGRLEKPYVLPLVKQLREVFKTSSNQTFNLVMIGGTRARKMYRLIENEVRDLQNVTLYITGYIFPIPKQFINNCDLFISAAGSAGASYSENKPTIRLNPTTGNIIGIIGLTFLPGELDAFSEGVELSGLKRTMKLALERKEDIVYVGTANKEMLRKEMKEEFDRQISFAEHFELCKYYDVMKIRYHNAAYKPFNYIGRYLSASFMYRSMEIARRAVK